MIVIRVLKVGPPEVDDFLMPARRAEVIEEVPNVRGFQAGRDPMPFQDVLGTLARAGIGFLTTPA
jgi:hypothetical protein